jgi:hypothetical protein
VSWLRERFALGVQLCGVVGVSVGFGLLAEWAGVVAGGVGLIALGVAAELVPMEVAHERYPDVDDE